MEKHRCKLCYRKFSNGRALGGHMKSHMINLPITPLKPESLSGSGSGSDSGSGSGSGSEPEEGEIVKEKLICKLNRENNVIITDVKLADESGGSSSVTLQDKGSDTESSKNVTRRRSKRTRKPVSSILQRRRDYSKMVCDDINNNEYGSSISDVTSEEDVAFCLMMMSRDTWSDNSGYKHETDYNSNIDYNNSRGVPISHKKKFKCETCNKVFRSYQALGGHRASHKKTRVTNAETVDNHEKKINVVVTKDDEKKIHECPVCFRVFASGQALGGHKRTHVIGNNSSVKSEIINNNNVQSPKKKKKVIDEIMIDLNLPAPIDDDYDEDFVTQIDISNVSNVQL